MMRWMLPVLLPVMAACAPSAPAHHAVPGAEATAAAVMEADRAFNEMAQRDGVPAAFAAYIDETDGKLFRPGEIVQGRAGVEADFSGWPETTALVWEPLGAHGAASGDLGVTWGDFRIEADGAILGTGHYVTAWRKNADGDWKGVIDIGVPAPSPAAETDIQNNQE